MKKLSLITILALSLPANAATLSAHANARALKPIAIFQTQPMRFGEFTIPTTGSGTIDTSGNVTGGVIRLDGQPRNKGIIGVTGQENRSYTMTVSSTVTLTRSGGSETLTASLTVDVPTQNLDNAGVGLNQITGVLTVPNTTIAGDYAGTYSVTANY